MARKVVRDWSKGSQGRGARLKAGVLAGFLTSKWGRGVGIEQRRRG
jgi:hypothetical protein